MSPDEVEAYRLACVRIDPETIQEDYVRTPADVAYWSQQYALVYQEWQLAKLTREQEWGNAVRRARAELASLRAKATVADVEGDAINDPAYVQAKRQEVLLESEKVRLGGMLDALRTKRDMLISLGAHLRAEMEQHILIKEREHEL